MGNTSEKYRKDLASARPLVENASERILCLKYESNRTPQISDEDKTEVCQALVTACDQLGVLLSANNYDIPHAEREGIRNIKEQMAVLRGAVEDYSAPATLCACGCAKKDTTLSSRIAQTRDNIQEFLNWADEKLQKKWWLSELIKFIRTLLLIATFLSASLAVAYPFLGSQIVTLSFTTASGVVDIINRVFVKGLSPTTVKVSTSKATNTNTTSQATATTDESQDTKF